MEIVDVRHQLAKHPSKVYGKRNIGGIKYIVIHHSATLQGDAFSFARYHVNNNDWPGIGYHYVILEDGTIQWTNDITVISNHVSGYNAQSVGICLVGDFTREILEQKQKDSLKELVKNLLEKLNLGIEAVVGHNQIKPGYTQCPALDMDALRQYISDDEVKIYVNNTKLDISAELKDGVTYVPLRPLAEFLGYDVQWDGDKKWVYLTKEDLLEQVTQEKEYYQTIINKIKNIILGV